ncbi:Asp23/Gls24 family envelope stress response protein [Actinokineospora sp.]|uniref:Asp23/Gls24 family envelope stress response protein n=1 Tax=Actinokineospora sp. TaxID=1872133 RepID=UPI003D6BD8EA
MSDVINSIFGRSKYDAPRHGDYTGASTPVQPATGPADVAVTDETVDTKAIEDEVTESVTETASAETDVEAADTDAAEDLDADIDADSDVDQAADDDAEDDVVEGDLAEGDVAEDDEAIEDAEDESDEAASADDTADLGDEDREAEPIAAESDDAPVPVAAEADVDDSDQAEPVVESVVEPAESRPAAGTRGSTTVGDGVVTKIVNLVARKADGVHDLGEEGISVEVDGDVATIKVSLVVEFGHAVNPVAEQVRVNVVEAVEQFLGLDVAVVDVHVTDIHIPDAV